MFPCHLWRNVFKNQTIISGFPVTKLLFLYIIFVFRFLLFVSMKVVSSPIDYKCYKQLESKASLAFNEFPAYCYVVWFLHNLLATKKERLALNESSRTIKNPQLMRTSPRWSSVLYRNPRKVSLPLRCCRARRRLPQLVHLTVKRHPFVTDPKVLWRLQEFWVIN